MIYLLFDTILIMYSVRPFFHVAMPDFLSEMGTRCVFCDEVTEFCNIRSIKSVLGRGPESRGIDSRWCHWNFSLILFFRPHYGHGIDSASNRNEYQEYFLGVKAAGA
jgi:hypothetical protein